MKELKLKAGKRAVLEVNDENGKGLYYTILQDWKEDTVTLGAPIANGAYVPLRTGTGVRVGFPTEGGQWTFDGVIVERHLDPLPVVVVTRNTPIFLRQQRDYFRIGMVLPVNYRVVIDTQQGIYGEWVTVKSRDIGGGGLLLLAKEALANGTLVEIDLTLPDQSIAIRAVGKVVRVTREEIGGNIVFPTGIQFVAIDEKERDRLIGFIFKEQRKWIKRGVPKGR